MHKLILASESPRRKTLLEEAGFFFHVFSVKVSENIEKNLISEAQINREISRIAETKAQAAFEAYKPSESGDYLILSADTLVIYQNQPLGKPKSSTEAEEFLTLLSGKTHQVKTAIYLLEAHFENQRWTLGRTFQDLTTTAVTFRLISRQEIVDYVASQEPMDKAGAYAIQGGGKKFVSSFQGPLDSVIGLPVAALQNILSQNKIEIESGHQNVHPLAQIQNEIKTFAKNPKARLLAVSKLRPTSKITQLEEQGQLAFAENYVQEALQKLEELKAHPIEWHFIGHLQKNKVKLIVGHFALIHSVDSLELAEKISQVCQAKNLSQRILLQLNLAGEQSKGGFSELEFRASLSKILALPGLEVLGLMTMPPLFADVESVRPYFAKLRALAEEFHFLELSMGTSSDYRIALQEGATLIRLGNVLFGERPQKNP